MSNNQQLEWQIRFDGPLAKTGTVLLGDVDVSGFVTHVELYASANGPVQLRLTVLPKHGIHVRGLANEDAPIVIQEALESDIVEAQEST